MFGNLSADKTFRAVFQIELQTMSSHIGRQGIHLRLFHFGIFGLFHQIPHKRHIHIGRKFLLLCRLLRIPYIVTATCTLISGMPAASLTAVLAGRYELDTETASLLVALSTVLSVVTIPVWYLILQVLT